MSIEKINPPSFDYEAAPVTRILRDGTEFDNNTEVDLQRTSGEHIRPYEEGRKLARMAVIDRELAEQQERPPTKPEIVGQSTAKLIILRRDTLAASEQKKVA